MNDPTTQLVLLLHAGATLAMFGLIWFVQIVHYPLMGLVGDDRYEAYQHDHMKRTTWIVGPFMLIEMVTAALLIPMLGSSLLPFTLSGLILLVLIWISTAALQVPAHQGLSQGFLDYAHRRLVTSNWIRTILWSLRGVFACVLIAYS